mmetsp:Transcript_67501/g.187138  ORF Transcript_67501/g.187138 Transcript_67501/m.187138 type:complete len:216 (+) Transcript_67501:142-789(+)
MMLARRDLMTPALDQSRALVMATPAVGACPSSSSNLRCPRRRRPSTSTSRATASCCSGASSDVDRQGSAASLACAGPSHVTPSPTWVRCCGSPAMLLFPMAAQASAASECAASACWSVAWRGAWRHPRRCTQSTTQHRSNGWTTRTARGRQRPRSPRAMMRGPPPAHACSWSSCMTSSCGPTLHRWHNCCCSKSTSLPPTQSSQRTWTPADPRRW